jgi:hypothetical protein
MSFASAASVVIAQLFELTLSGRVVAKLGAAIDPISGNPVTALVLSDKNTGVEIGRLQWDRTGTVDTVRLITSANPTLLGQLAVQYDSSTGIATAGVSSFDTVLLRSSQIGVSSQGKLTFTRTAGGVADMVMGPAAGVQRSVYFTYADLKVPCTANTAYIDAVVNAVGGEHYIIMTANGVQVDTPVGVWNPGVLGARGGPANCHWTYLIPADGSYTFRLQQAKQNAGCGYTVNAANTTMHIHAICNI